jgi:hypothetical protein
VGLYVHSLVGIEREETKTRRIAMIEVVGWGWQVTPPTNAPFTSNGHGWETRSFSTVTKQRFTEWV